MSQYSDTKKSALSTSYFKVFGRVQGVFFRAATKNMADRYELKGWVKNLPGGEVEGIVSGDPARLKLFLEWLKEGPEMARVLKLELKELPGQEFDTFEIR